MQPTESTQTAPRSRRALLAGAIGGLGVWAASAIGRVAPAEAAAGDPIRMGRLNRALGTQTILQTRSSGAAFLVRQASGATAIRGETTSGRAVVGYASSDGTGVWGDSRDHLGVKATSITGNAIEATSRTGWGALIESEFGTGLEVSGGNMGIRVSTGTGYAGLFSGPIFADYQDLSQLSNDPPAPGPTNARVFARNNGAGKMQLCVRFPTGAVQVIATEP
jgi:hypothetical protein